MAKQNSPEGFSPGFKARNEIALKGVSDGVRRQAFTKLHFKVMGLTRSKALRPKTRGGDALSAATFRAIFLIDLTRAKDDMSRQLAALAANCRLYE